MKPFTKFLRIKFKKLIWLSSILIILAQPMAALAQTSLDQCNLHHIYNDTNWYDPCSQTASINCQSTTASATNLRVSNLDLSFKDASRGGRPVGASIYYPSDSQKHPLVIFAPGRDRDSKPNGLYARYLNAIAAQGFTVAGANFSDNNSLSAIPADAQDISFLISSLEQSSKVQDKIDTTNGVGLIGHSDGGMIALIEGYATGKKDGRISLVISEDGAMYPGFSFGSGPPLFLMHGTADTIQDISSSIQAFSALSAKYKAFAKVIDADHYRYITDVSPKYNPAVEGMTGAFLKRVLEGDSSQATSLSALVKSQFSDVVNLQEQGNDSSIVGQPMSNSNSTGSGNSNSGGNSNASSISKGSVYFVGDSLTVGMRDSGQLVSKLQAAGWQSTGIEATVGISTETSRQIIDGSDQRAKADQTAIANSTAIVVALGTNDGKDTSADTFTLSIKDMISTIKKYNANISIYWMNAYADDNNGNNTYYNGIEQAIQSQSSSLGYRVIDWHTEALNNRPKYEPFKGIPGPPLVHPTDHYDALANFVVNSLANQGSGSAGSCSCGTGGAVSDLVPAPYNTIFTAAANKFQVDPAFLAAIFYGGEHANSWPNPPPPYGTGGPWATSPAGAEGPFQFLPSTWATYGVDSNGDGRVDIQDLTDAAFGAAKYLAALGAANNTDESALRLAAGKYNGTGPHDSYANSVWNAYLKFRSGETSSGCTSSITGCTNPFPGGWIPNRLDMGYDGTFKGQIVAPCSGTITYAGNFNGWNGSYGVIIKFDNDVGLPTRSLFFTEGVQPIVKSGQHVNAGDAIANAYPSPYGDAYGTNPAAMGEIEWGVNQDGPIGVQVDTYAIALGNSCKPGSASQQMVLNFAKWAEQNLNVAPPSSTDHAGCA